MPKDMDYNVEVGKRLFNARKVLKMTRAELGRKVGLHESTVKRYEDGQIKSLDIDKMKEFAIALDTSPAYLMGWDEPTPEEKENGYNIGTMLHDPIKMQIVNIVAGMSDEEAKALLTLLRK